jgi:hypothetical protein
VALHHVSNVDNEVSEERLRVQVAVLRERNSLMDIFGAPQMRTLLLPICRDIAPTLIGREFAELDPVRDASALKEVCRMANIVRYIRMGVTPHWIPQDELECAQKLALSKGF